MEYILINEDGRAYYFYDSINACNIIKAKIIDDYRQIGTYKQSKDSIFFSFDSCADIKSVVNVYINGTPKKIIRKTFSYDIRQSYSGKVLKDTITFNITTNDSIHWTKKYIRMCRNE
jgi:hypothetical protein